MAQRVERLDGRVEKLDDRLGALSDKLDTSTRGLSQSITELRHSFDLFKPVGDDIRRVVQLLEGNGDPKKGIVYRVLTLETDYAVKSTWLSRLAWLVIGCLVTVVLAGLGAAFLDLAKRGILG